MQNTLTISITDPAPQYHPGTELHGRIDWQLTVPQSISLSLYWYTSGRGGRDAETVQRREIFPTTSAGSQSFTLLLPDAPYSYHGMISSLNWKLEAATRTGVHQAVDLVISPTGYVIHLNTVPSRTAQRNRGHILV